MRRILEVAEGQWGLITRRQAEAAGVAWSSLARLAATGMIERVAHGVYRVRGGGEPDHLALRAAWLQLDPGRPAWERLGDPRAPVVSHASEAALYGVGDLRPDVHEFTVPARRQSRRPDVRLHQAQVPIPERAVLGGLPVTRPARLVADLLSDHVEPAAVAGIAAELLDRRLEDEPGLAGSLGPYAARFGYWPGDGRAMLSHLLELARRAPAGSLAAEGWPR
jgi:hypothetical protein